MSAVVSNHDRFDCLLMRLFRRRSKKTSKLRVSGLFEGNSPVNSPHKKPVTRKLFLLDDVIMVIYFLWYRMGKWIRCQYYGRWWSGSLAPGYQQPQCCPTYTNTPPVSVVKSLSGKYTTTLIILVLFNFSILRNQCWWLSVISSIFNPLIVSNYAYVYSASTDTRQPSLRSE